jgi:hypothetical protein
MRFGTGKNGSRGLGRQSLRKKCPPFIASLIASRDEGLGPFRFHLYCVGAKRDTLISDLEAGINPTAVLKRSLAPAVQLPLKPQWFKPTRNLSFSPSHVTI